MPKLRGRKIPVTWQLPPEVVAFVDAFAKFAEISKQAAAEKLIVSGFKQEMRREKK